MIVLEELEASLLFNPERLMRLHLKDYGLVDISFDFYLDYKNSSFFSGNKLRKLYGSLKHVVENEIETIVTVGGNYSNYLYACSFIPELLNKRLIAIVKGHEPEIYGYTLKQLKSKGVELVFSSNKDLDTILKKLVENTPNSMFIPEGGSNEHSHIGFQSLVQNNFDKYNYICMPVGLLDTYKGVEKYKSSSTNLLGYATHKDFSLSDKGNISYNYHFGGFAKMTPELLNFCEDFHRRFQIPLDPVYTSKMIYGIIEDFKKGKFSSNQKVLSIHTGGLQGWHGQKNKPNFNWEEN